MWFTVDVSAVRSLCSVDVGSMYIAATFYTA